MLLIIYELMGHVVMRWISCGSGEVVFSPIITATPGAELHTFSINNTGFENTDWYRLMNKGFHSGALACICTADCFCDRLVFLLYEINEMLLTS